MASHHALTNPSAPSPAIRLSGQCALALAALTVGLLAAFAGLSASESPPDLGSTTEHALTTSRFVGLALVAIATSQAAVLAALAWLALRILHQPTHP
jgi:hypothetical protein